MNERLLEEICNFPDLPTLPAVALRAVELTESKTTSASDVAAVIANDPALSSKVLRTVNSPFYGVTHSISSIQSAVTILGLQSVKTLVLGFSLVSMMNAGKKNPRAFDHLNYWRRSLYAATAARVIASRVGSVQVESCFVAALLMDIGMLVLERCLGERYAAVVRQTTSHNDLVEAEIEALDLSHDQVAGVLAQRWNLPESLSVPLSYHHRPELLDRGSERQTTNIIAVAARCADVFVDRQAMWSIADARRLCGEQFKISEIDCDSMLVEIGHKTRGLAPLFEVQLAAEADYETILRRANDELMSVTQVGANADSEASDRRRAPRIRRDKEVAVLPCNNGTVGQSIPVRLHDVSARGVGFSHAQPMKKGQQFIFSVPRNDAPAATLLYTVVRCIPKADGKYVVGAELACVLKEIPKAA